MRQLRVLFLAWLAAALLPLAPACAADGFSVVTKDGYARLVFAPDPAGEVKAKLTGSILTVGFAHPTTISPAAVRQALPGYVTEARIDADRKTLRIALNQSVRLHLSAATGRTAVDLLPASYAGTPPPLAGLAGSSKPAPVDLTKLDALKIRAGSYKNFTRIVFDWPRSVPYRVIPSPGHLTVRFSAPAQPDFTALARVIPPWVKAQGWRLDGRDTVVELSVDSDSGFHDFRDGTNVVVDILAPRTDADAYRPPGDAKVAVTRFGAAPKGEAASIEDRQRREIESAANKLNGTNLKPPKSDKPAPAPDAKPATPSVAKTLTLDAKLAGGGLVLTIADAATRKVAAFMRGSDAWIVLLGDLPFDHDAIAGQLGGAATAVDAVAANGVSVLRLSLRAPTKIAAFADGSDMKIVVAPQAAAHGDVQTISFSRQQDDYARMVLQATLPGSVKAVTLNDPAVKDRIVVVPGALGQAVPSERAFVEFAALQTAAGIALIPYVDDLSVKVETPRVAISRGSGLSITQNGMPTLVLPAGDVAGDQAFLDFASWGRWHEGSFLATQRALRAAAANQPAARAFDARLALARFYLANDFDAEALGLINILSASNPPAKAAVQLMVMRAAANYRMGRTRDASNAMSGGGLDANRHVMLWRGLVRAEMGDNAGAAADLDRAMPVVGRYVPAVQAEVRLAAAKVALALGKYDYAKAQVDRLPSNMPAAVNAEADLIRARLGSAWGDKARAADLYASAEKHGNGRISAEAIYWRIIDGLQNGGLTTEQGINALERLRYRWRGDALELTTLEKLASLYFKKQRWRDGLATLRIAAKYFPGSDEGNKAQDEMRGIFAMLFLKGKADTMKPAEALGLFYDFVDLTPIGPDGDDMIRKMADRLAKVDLLGPAADLLQYQVARRLDTAMAKAQVSTRLAMIRLMDHRPKEALETLTSTNLATLPDADRYQRLLMQARALMELKRWDEAIDLIDVETTPEVARLRAEIYWRSGNWAVAGQKSEQLLGDCWHDGAPLSDENRQLTMRTAVAYALAGDEASLARIRARFFTKMNASPDAAAFTAVTQRTDMQGMAFRQAAAKVAAVDTLQSFMKSLEKLK